MKVLFVLLTLSTSALLYAAETTTECLMMRESNERSNPKVSVAQIKVKQNKGSATAQ